MQEGRNIRELGQGLRGRVNALLANTLTTKPLIANYIRHPDERLRLGFRDGGSESATLLATRYGPVRLAVTLLYDTVGAGERSVRLRTLEYQYTLRPIGAVDPIVRWEFVRFPGDEARWCRHHVQGPIAVDLGGAPVSLNDFHLPTGWVSIEDVVRFCIVDLGVQPLSDDWHERLVASEGTPGD